MTETFAVSLDGYTDLPPGKIANVVTFLERTAVPSGASEAVESLEIRHVQHPAPAWYRTLYRRIGEEWLWFSRGIMSDDELTALLAAPETTVLVAELAGEAVGLAELSTEGDGNVEIVTFGVVPEATGRGIARALMERTLAHAFSAGARRVWLHTCTFDHPGAVRFYRKCGFSAWKFAIEVSDDPRATGALPQTAAPHVPFLSGKR